MNLTVFFSWNFGGWIWYCKLHLFDTVSESFLRWYNPSQLSRIMFISIVSRGFALFCNAFETRTRSILFIFYCQWWEGGMFTYHLTFPGDSMKLFKPTHENRLNLLIVLEREKKNYEPSAKNSCYTKAEALLALCIFFTDGFINFSQSKY